MGPAFSRRKDNASDEAPAAPSRITYLELTDVPAAVVCARCGDAECAGCEVSAEATASGVLVFVPWERPGLGVWARFWAMTRVSTEGAESFFAELPAGPVAPALAFAALAEVIAVGSTVGVAAIGLGLVGYEAAPRVVLYLLRSPLAIARVTLVAWLSFTCLLLVARALHGAALDRAAQREGRAAKLGLALRFGFYAAGLDVATSPVGVLHALFTRGPRYLIAVGRYAGVTMGRATSALLRGVYRLEEAQVKRAKRRALWVPVGVSIAGVFAALVASALAW